MKKFVIGVFAAALATAPMAFAQQDHHDDKMDTQHHDTTQDHHDTMGGPMHHDDTMGGPMHHDDTMHGPGGMMGMHHPMHHGWHHGDRLPRDYWHSAEIDWHHYHLRRPPRGYHWVRVDDDFVLVRLSDGLILDIGIAP